ncbi:hypothetical protein QAD02_001858 [Eretmocerus hayati]|uniref:Uncharacterized protein n=1 Tax=Eretmocerus hayati TaxID=131215 RepID=A0ACC2NH83_9HYME|nr:hypothetical protein QAD02_001858 [Eretmocerus hayati]
MSAKLLLHRIIGGCFHGMHCLGAVGISGQPSPANTSPSSSSSSSGNLSSSSNGSPGSTRGGGGNGNALAVVRALGVLVCEGRIQGSTRGYTEGPHCVAPLQPAPPSDHVCENDNYLCDRYLVLVREITERVSIGSYLCVEVVLCSDCPCGLIKSKCKNRVLSVPPITSWQHNSEMLLEYWCIGIVPNKSPETMMNSQGLYQALRSRLHFSQVAAWWSRTSGAKPSYIATRIVPHSLGDEPMRKFREAPVEHTFPLASLGDGSSVKVTMWALPRMEQIPSLQCPLHPHQQMDENRATLVPAKLPSNAATPLGTGPGTPLITATGTVTSTPISAASAGDPNSLTSGVPCGPDPTTVIDGLATPAQLPALAASSHASLHLQQRQRRLSRGSSLSPSSGGVNTSESPPFYTNPFTMQALDCGDGMVGGLLGVNGVLEAPILEHHHHHCRCAADEDEPGLEEVVVTIPRPNGERKRRRSLPCRPPEPPPLAPAGTAGPSSSISSTPVQPTSSNNNSSSSSVVNPLPKLSEGVSTPGQQPKKNQHQTEQETTILDGLERSFRTQLSIEGQPEGNRGKRIKRSESLEQQYQQQQQKQDKPCSGKQEPLMPWVASYSANGVAVQSCSSSTCCGGSSATTLPSAGSPPTVRITRNPLGPNNRKGEQQQQQGILDWISRVPGRVMAVANETNVCQQQPSATTAGGRKCEQQSQPHPTRGCNLDLSPREFDEVLAVLRARTPMGRRRAAALRTAKRRDKYDRLHNEPQPQHHSVVVCNRATKLLLDAEADRDHHLDGSAANKADVLMGAILRSTGKGRSASAEAPTAAREADEPAAGPSIIPGALNKRLSRLRQLFKREQDSVAAQAARALSPNDRNDEPVIYSLPLRRLARYQQLQQQYQVQRESRVKRRIDFSGDASEAVVDSSSSSSSGNSSSTDEAHEAKDVREDNDKNNNSSSSSSSDGSSTCCYDQIELDLTDKTIVPSAKEQQSFRRSLENAASMVFHSRTGLPLTSSPAPLRRGSCCFDFDSSLNSVSSKRSALFELNTPPSPGAVSLEENDRETEHVCDIEEVNKRRSNSRNRPQSYALLGNFEESALNGRLEPVSTVHGFTAEIGASGSFCPKHRKLPVTVFFYTLGDNDKVSSPYLAHINLGKKGYQVPRSGTIQVTLSNPLGTVVKMFVVLYDLTDMPPRSHTFLRQRTLRDKTLRYLIHLRFMSGKSGRIYLHTDIRMIICRKSDVDTASDLGSEPPKELRSYIYGPTNPKFSPRC